MARVAERHELTPKWLNDRSRPFLPVTFDIEDCEVLLDDPRLLVLGASFDQVFIMKVHAGRATDADDLEALWPRCSVETPDEAGVAYRAAYPHGEPAPHLADWLATII